MINSVVNSNYANGVGNVNFFDKFDTQEITSGEAFEKIFDSVAKSLNEVDELQKSSDAMTLKFITGEEDNIHNVLIEQEKALVALQFTSEVTNKCIEAYNEIMRMQI